MRIVAITGPRARKQDLRPFAKLFPSLMVLAEPTLEDARRQLSDGANAVLIFGGDGTLNRYLELLVTTQAPVLAVPVGSGNDFSIAHGVNSPRDAENTFRDFLKGSGQAVAADLGQVKWITADGTGRPHYFACCVNIGLDADAARMANTFPDWLKSKKGYFVAGAAAILRFQPEEITVSGPGVSTLSEPAWFTSVSNTPTFGGGLKIAPDASTRDGRFDVSYLPAIPRRQLLKHLPKILNGTHMRVSALRTFRAITLRVHTGRPMPVYADGEYMGQSPVEITIIPNAIRVVQRRTLQA